MKIMNKKEHQERHNLLHEKLDELVADYIEQTKDTAISKTPIIDLMIWSGQQKKEVDHKVNK